MYRPCTSRIRAKPYRHVPVLCPLYHYILYTHTHCRSICISYAYDGKSRQHIGIYTQSCTMPQTRTIVRSRVNHNCTKYDFTHVCIKHNYVRPLVYAQCVTVTHVTRQTYKCTSCPYYIYITNVVACCFHLYAAPSVCLYKIR